MEVITIKIGRLQVRHPTLRPINGFYITTEATTTTTTRKPPPVAVSTPSPTPPSPQNIKYIKLEPVILQKTILNDGRVIYYWHKSLPSTVQLAPSVPMPQTQTLPSTPATTTTSTTPSGGYDFRNFFPSFYSFGGSEQSATTTTEKTTTAPSTTTSATSDASDDLMYEQQLRFVVPVPYANADDQNIRKLGEFDQFAYYPKPLQPETVNLQVPYVPTFHMIKALAVPNQYEGGPKIDDYSSIDNVNI